MTDQMQNIIERLERLESLIGIQGKVESPSTLKIKAVIKKGANDFNNRVQVNPYPIGSPESEWWDFGFKYAKELDEAPQGT